MSYRILTDTSANLPSPWLAAHQVGVIPFVYIVDGEERTCLDTEAFDGHAFYEGMRRGMKPTTSQINPQIYEDAFAEAAEAGEDLLFLSMSSGISGSYHCAQLGAEAVRERFPERKIYTIDTRGASLGEGIPVMRAVELRDAGAGIEEVYEEVSQLCVRMCQIFMVDDLMNLRRTGRLSNAAAIVGTVLRIKPLLKGNELGQIVNTDIIRTRKKALTALADKYARWVVNPEEQTVGIAHADCEKDALFLAQMLRERANPKEILIVGYEPVTGCHVGPDTVALFFESDAGVRSRN